MNKQIQIAELKNKFQTARNEKDREKIYSELIALKLSEEKNEIPTIQKRS